MDKETLRMQMLSGVITESEYKAKLEKLNSTEEKNSLNEHYVAGGIVGIGAINQIPSRAKADYEDAFEYFLSQKYSLNEMEDIEEVKVETLPDEVKNSKEFKNLVALLKSKPDAAEELADEFKKLEEEFKYYDYSGTKKVEITKKDYIKNKLQNAGFWAALSAVIGGAMAGLAGGDDVLQAALTTAGFLVPIGTGLSSSTGREKVEEKSLYEANPLEGGPGYMTKYRIGVLSALIADAEKDLIKYEEEGLLSPELTEKIKGTIEKLKSSREDLKSLYREETNSSQIYENEDDDAAKLAALLGIDPREAERLLAQYQDK